MKFPVYNILRINNSNHLIINKKFFQKTEHINIEKIMITNFLKHLEKVNYFQTLCFSLQLKVIKISSI